MTLFEYLSVAVSIVLALGVAHLLSNVKPVLDATRRYWVHSLWAAQLLLIHALEWWALWSFRDTEWSFGHFLLVLSGPGVLFVCSTILIPTGLDSSWRSHYYSVHRWFFLALLALLLQTILMVWLLGGTFILTPGRLWWVLCLGALVGVATKRPRVHAALVVASLLLLLVLSVDQLRPDAA